MKGRILAGLAAAVCVAACSANSRAPAPAAQFANATAVTRAGAEIGGRISVARFDEEGRLILPDDIDRWTPLGASVGLDYADGPSDPANPRVMNMVTMEPTAYRYFMETGRFAEGTMFHLGFHSIVRDERLNSSGFATGPVVQAEIHYKDSEMFPDGFNFFNFAPGQTAAAAVPLPNACVECHMANADHEGVFVQFYPNMLARLQEGAAE